MRLLEKINSNCYIKKAGFTYPILFYNDRKCQEAAKKLTASPQFGEAARSYHYTTFGGSFRVKNFCAGSDIENRKWYIGPVKWNSKRKNESWIVFKTERDRTLALMILG
jgi:hypothetical protein